MLAKSISGAAAAVQPAFIEDVFSTYLYTGNGSTQTITNGIDLAGKGGLVWIKGRSGATGHRLTDTARGVTKSLESNSSAAGVTESTGLTAFNGTGFSIGADADYNTNTATYVSWTFRKQAKFFDVVAYTGDGSANPRQIAHSLGSVPGFIVIKRTDTTSDWTVWHRSVTGNAFLQTTGAWQSGFTRITTPDASTFTVGASSAVNANGGTYVAYLFAHDAGGFGLTGTDNVISCGSFTTDGSGNATVNLGYEPQWILTKLTGTPVIDDGSWKIYDVMRRWTTGGQVKILYPNITDGDWDDSGRGGPTATGFSFGFQANATYIYIAIRRGPMRVPTSGTSVFSPVTQAGSGTVTTNFPVDLSISTIRLFDQNRWAIDRLRGASGTASASMYPNAHNAEVTPSGYGLAFDNNTGYKDTGVWSAGNSIIYWNFRRAPGFFDVVAYTGTGVARTVNHNLAAVPEMMIVKRRNAVADWWMYDTATGNTKYQVLNSTATPVTSSTAWNNTTPTSSVFTVGTGTPVNASGGTYIAYLFATTPGVSKVGSYTGSGTTKQIDCGFTGGARFVLIKRTDSTGDWYVWDTARGIVAGNDPYLLLNSTASEVTSTDYIDTYSAGFEISSTAPAAINANGGTYIFLAVS